MAAFAMILDTRSPCSTQKREKYQAVENETNTIADDIDKVLIREITIQEHCSFFVWGAGT